MTGRNTSNSKASRGASSSKTSKNNNANGKKRKQNVTPKNNLQKNHQDSLILSPSRDNDSLGCNQVTPNSGRTKKISASRTTKTKAKEVFQ